MCILHSAALAAVVLSLPATAGAQEGTFTFLGRLILAAGLTSAPEAALPRVVTVVTGEELRQRGIDQAADALRAVPGVAVNRACGPGGLTQLRLRGTEGRHVQVILDGVRLDPAQNGEFDFAGLQTADIERIEVIRGPQSVFFGSNTIGGVISITTRRATEPGVSGQVGLEGGSDGTLGGDFQLGLRGERGGLTFSGVARNEGGYDISATPGGVADGMRNRTLNLAGDWQVSDTWRLGFLLRARNQTNDSDPQQYAAGPISDIVFDRDDFLSFQERIAGVTAEGDLADGRLRMTLRASHFIRDSQRFTAAVRGSDDTADRTELTIRRVWVLDGGTPDTARHTLAFGIDRTTEGFVNNNPAYVFDPSQ
jgi:vitamin B12 transporter